MGSSDEAGDVVSTSGSRSSAPDGTPILVYAGGMGVYPANTAGGVADVLATAIDRRSPGRYISSSLATVTSPKALKLGKSVTDENGRAVLHVFELDYKALLRSTSNEAGPPPSPGVVRSAALAIRATGMFVAALGRPGKSKMAKFQLAYALLILCALILATVVAFLAGLVASGVPIPDRVESWFSDGDATATLVLVGGASVLSWTATRRWLLAIATTTQDTIRYVDNDNRHRDSVSLTVDDALDGLRDNGWTGPIHLFGYSMGSLVVFDACFPRAASRRAPLATVSSIVTVGCPLDAVRLFRPRYVDDRFAGRDGPPWINVYQATDVFGSNLANSNDADPDAPATFVDDVPVRSLRYLDTELRVMSSLAMSGFRSHSGYWSGPKDGNCFNELLPVWLPDLPYRS